MSEPDAYDSQLDPDDPDHPDYHDGPLDAWSVEFATEMSAGVKRFPTEQQARAWAEEHTERFGASTWILPTAEHKAMESDTGMIDDR